MDALHIARDYIDALTGVKLHEIEGSREAWTQFIRQDTPDFLYLERLTDTMWETLCELSERVIYNLHNTLRVDYLLLLRKEASSCIAIGPFLTELPDEAFCREVLQSNDLDEDFLVALKHYYADVPITAASSMIGAAQVLAGHLLGEKHLPVRELHKLRGEEERILLPPQTEVRLEQVADRYALEGRFFQEVGLGNVEAALELQLQLRHQDAHFKRVTNPLRSQKNWTVILCALLSRTVMRQGVHPFFADVAFWDFLYRCEQKYDLKELPLLRVEMVEAFCKLVKQYAYPGFSPPVRRAVEYLQAHLSSAPSLAEVASYAGVEGSYLSTRFKRETGLGVTDYANRERVYRMARMLGETRFPVSEIAFYAGFTDPNYAARVFHRYMGTSPTDYRKNPGARPGAGVRPPPS